MTNSLKFDDLNVQTEIKLDMCCGAVYLIVDDITVKIPLETFNKIVDRFPVLLDGGYT